jgi:hypothetical protein
MTFVSSRNRFTRDPQAGGAEVCRVPEPNLQIAERPIQEEDF